MNFAEQISARFWMTAALIAVVPFALVSRMQSVGAESLDHPVFPAGGQVLAVADVPGPEPVDPRSAGPDSVVRANVRNRAVGVAGASMSHAADDLHRAGPAHSHDGAVLVLGVLRGLEGGLSAHDPSRIEGAKKKLAGMLREHPELAWDCLDLLEDRANLTDEARVALLRVLAEETDLSFQQELVRLLSRQENEASAAFPTDRSVVLGRLDGVTSPETTLRTLQALPDSWSRDPQVMSVLEQLARNSDDPRIRALALYRRQIGGGEDAVDLFLEEISGEIWPEVRVAAIRALASSDTRRGGDVLLQILLDPSESPAARGFAATGLGKHADLPGATETLIEELRTSGLPGVRLSALQSLGDHAQTRLEATAALLDEIEMESDPSLRALAAASLRRAAASDGLIADLARLRDLETDDNIRTSLTRALDAWRANENG